MGRITVVFHGVCTHLKNELQDVPHRVVLVETDEIRHIHGDVIAPHKPSLESEHVKNGTLPRPASRLTLTISNAVKDPISYTDCYNCAIWPLKQYTGDPSLGLNLAVVDGKKAPGSIYFDAPDGTFEAYLTKGGASVAKLIVETDGDPVLQIESWDRPSISSVEFEDDAVLDVKNVSTPGHENDRDFVLHYLTTDRSFDKYPKDPAPCTEYCSTKEDDYIDLGPGCSNSNYP